jgi:hypothetical protein
MASARGLSPGISQKHLVLIIQEAAEWVVWDAVYISLLDPGNHRLCAGKTRAIRAKILFAVLSNTHPEFIVRVFNNEVGEEVVLWHLILGEFERGDPRMMINTSVLSIYERMDTVFVHLTGGQQRSHNPDYEGEPDRRPGSVLAAELNERGRLATMMLMSDVLHCAALATDFSGH